MNKERLPSILTYITLIGFIVAVILNSSKDGEDKRFNAFHMRQSLGLFIVIAILNTLLRFLGLMSISGAVNLVYLIVIVLQIVGAANQEYKFLPYIGKKIEEILGRLFE